MGTISKYKKTIIMSPNLRGGGYIDFGADPVGVGVCVVVNFSLLHN